MLQEECHVSVFLRFCNVELFDALLAEPFCKDVVHSLWGEGDGEGVVGFVLGHGGDVEVFGEVEVWEGGGVDAEELGYFADAVGAVVEEKEGVPVCVVQAILVLMNRVHENGIWR